jgi:hypothetical protein
MAQNNAELVKKLDKLYGEVVTIPRKLALLLGGTQNDEDLALKVDKLYDELLIKPERLAKIKGETQNQKRPKGEWCLHRADFLQHLGICLRKNLQLVMLKRDDHIVVAVTYLSGTREVADWIGVGKTYAEAFDNLVEDFKQRYKEEWDGFEKSREKKSRKIPPLWVMAMSNSRGKVPPPAEDDD